MPFVYQQKYTYFYSTIKGAKLQHLFLNFDFLSFLYSVHFFYSIELSLRLSVLFEGESKPCNINCDSLTLKK